MTISGTTPHTENRPPAKQEALKILRSLATLASPATSALQPENGYYIVQTPYSGSFDSASEIRDELIAAYQPFNNIPAIAGQLSTWGKRTAEEGVKPALPGVIIDIFPSEPLCIRIAARDTLLLRDVLKHLREELEQKINPGTRSPVF